MGRDLNRVGLHFKSFRKCDLGAISFRAWKIYLLDSVKFDPSRGNVSGEMRMDIFISGA